jgi:hypothetical protein
VACVDWLMMWYSCISKEVSLVDQTNISMDDEQLSVNHRSRGYVETGGLTVRRSIKLSAAV